MERSDSNHERKPSPTPSSEGYCEPWTNDFHEELRRVDGAAQERTQERPIKADENTG
jgi:hypothetical protein